MAEKLRNMREDLLKVNPPEKCRIDTQALVSIAELAEKSAENKSLNSEDENEKNRMYYTSLIMTFDICAKKCAGEYYNSYLLG